MSPINAHEKSTTHGSYILARVSDILSNLCRATSGGYINFGCSIDVLFLRGYYQWSMSLRGGEIFAGRER